MEIDFRNAIKNDVEDVIPLMYSAAPEMLEYSYTLSGKTAKEFLKFAFSEGKGFFGYKQQIIGTFTGKIIFSATSYPGKEVFKLTLEMLHLYLRFYGITGSFPVFYRALILSGLFMPPKSDSQYFANVGTSEKFRSKGIGSKFFIMQQEKAKQNGMKRCELDVSIMNPQAEKLYLKLGYKVVKVLEYRGKEKISGTKRMEIIV